MKRNLSLFLAVAAVLASCQFQPGETKQEAQMPVGPLTRADVLALMHLEKSHETSVDALKADVAAMLNDGPSARNLFGEAATVITGVREYNITVENGFATGTADRRSALAEPGEAEIPFFLFTLENQENGQEGFALVSGDTRIGDVLAVVEYGSFESDDPFMSMVRSNIELDVLQTIAMYNAVTASDIDVAVQKSAQIRDSETPATRTMMPFSIGPLTHKSNIFRWNQWGQRDPFNRAVMGTQGTGAQVSMGDIGTDVAAVAQIMFYYRHPAAPGNQLVYRIEGDSNGPRIDRWVHGGYTRLLSLMRYDWEGISYMRPGSGVSEYGDQLATISLQAAAAIGKRYLGSSSDSGAEITPIDQVRDGLLSMGFKADQPRGFDGKSAINVYGEESDDWANIIMSIMNERPVYMHGWREDNSEWGNSKPPNRRAAWLVDGVKVEHHAGYSLWLPEPVSFIHVIAGKGGLSDGWYRTKDTVPATVRHYHLEYLKYDVRYLANIRR